MVYACWDNVNNVVGGWAERSQSKHHAASSLSLFRLNCEIDANQNYAPLNRYLNCNVVGNIFRMTQFEDYFSVLFPHGSTIQYIVIHISLAFYTCASLFFLIRTHAALLSAQVGNPFERFVSGFGSYAVRRTTASDHSGVRLVFLKLVHSIIIIIVIMIIIISSTAALIHDIFMWLTCSAKCRVVVVQTRNPLMLGEGGEGGVLC